MAFLHEHIILPLSDLLNGEQVHKYLRLLKDAENWTPEQMANFQQQRLRKLLKYAAKEVPFYREWFHDHNLNPDTVSLDQMPIVSKNIMRQEGIERFSSEHFPAKQRLTSRSSGSTGAPFTFYETKLSYSVNMAAKLRTWYKAGYRLGDSYVKIAYTNRPFIKKIQDYINNCHYLVFHSPSQSDMDSLLRKVNMAKPTVIRAHANIAFYLAQAQERLHLDIWPHVIMTTATTLTATYRDTICKSFCCDVIDSYSCEGTPNTYETHMHDGYHICDYYGIIEFLDANNIPVNNGIARIVSTDLWNHAHPFIRYDTQDCVELKNGVVRRILGRANECFTATNGTIFTGYAIGDYFTLHQQNVLGYQFVCHKNDYLTINIVPSAAFRQEQVFEIENYWRLASGQQVEVQVLDYIPTSGNGKQKTIIVEQ